MELNMLCFTRRKITLQHCLFLLFYFYLKQERTELMMKDLTGKVIDMLEDSNLEAVKVRARAVTACNVI